MLRGITTARYTMKATLIRPIGPTAPAVDPSATGVWADRQDPDTGEIVRVWEAISIDNPDTPESEIGANVIEIECMARGINEGGIRAAATTENFDDIYHNIDIINLWVPKRYRITKRDRVTNIRTKDGTILWRDEEDENSATPTKATIFNVNGVVPNLDPFNRHIDNFCLLERAEV